MTHPVPRLFDRGLQRRRLARAAGAGFADFLVAHAADELHDRLSAVLRRFRLALDLGTPSGHAAAVLRRGPAETVLRAAPAAALAATGGWTIVADEEALPVAPGRVDLVTSLLALQGLNDLPGALVQIRQVLAPDGLFLACLLGGATLRELRHSFAAAEAELEGGGSPRVAPFGDVRDMGALLQRAGFALPVADTDILTVRYAHPLALLRDLRAMGLTNTLVERRGTPLRRATLMRMAEIYAADFAGADRRVIATFELIWLSGWAPHESQAKPLRPGSAAKRLAEALGTREATVAGTRQS